MAKILDPVRRALVKKYNDRYKARVKAWYLKNRDERLKKAKFYADEHKVDRAARAREYYRKNKERIRAYFKLWFSENKARMYARAKQYRLSHKDQQKALMTAWLKENLDYVKRKNAEWRQENKGKVNLYSMRRKAAKIKAIPCWRNDFFIEEAYDLAQLRTKATGFEWHVDHIIPLQGKTVCGLHVENNLQVIPASQNQSKSNARWPDMP